MRSVPPTGQPRHTEAAAPVDVARFVAASSVLTGFDAVDLYGTGQADFYLAFVAQTAGNDVLATLCERVEAGQAGAVMADTTGLGQFAKNVITLWYLGAWGTQPHLISADTYVSGLVWDAIEAHPPAAKQQGFGAWALPPEAPL